VKGGGAEPKTRGGVWGEIFRFFFGSMCSKIFCVQTKGASPLVVGDNVLRPSERQGWRVKVDRCVINMCTQP